MAEDDELLESVGELDGAHEHEQLRIDRADDGDHVVGVQKEVEDLLPGWAAALAAPCTANHLLVGMEVKGISRPVEGHFEASFLAERLRAALSLRLLPD